MKPSEALDNAGLKPEDITDVIISHIHWDHADGFDLFPKAKIWIQKDELEYYAGEAWQSRRTAAARMRKMCWDSSRLNTEGKVGLVKGDAQEIIPGITCYTGGKHTYQSQFIGVKTAAGIVILASDNVYLIRESGEACAHRRNARCGIEFEGAGPDEATGGEPEAHCSRARSGGDEEFY